MKDHESDPFALKRQLDRVQLEVLPRIQVTGIPFGGTEIQFYENGTEHMIVASQRYNPLSKIVAKFKREFTFKDVDSGAQEGPYGVPATEPWGGQRDYLDF